MTTAIARRSAAAVVFGALASLSSTTTFANDPFYKGKTMTIIVSTGAAGSYGDIARTFKRYMPSYLAGEPTIVVKAMPGAGNVLATNYLYNIAPRDGTTIGTINNSIPLHQVIDGQGVRYDASKFNWLGSTGNYNAVVFVWHGTGVKTLEDAAKTEVVIGGTGPASSIVIYPSVMSKVLGSKFRILVGYKTVQEIDVAMERGEVGGRSGSYTALTSEHPDWLKDKKVNLLIQVGLKKEKALGDLPLLMDVAKTPEQREVLKLISSPIGLGRPYLAPPDVPAERLTELRKAFMATMQDKGFLVEAGKLGHEIEPISGEEVARIVNDTINAPATVIAAARDLLPKRKPKEPPKDAPAKSEAGTTPASNSR